MFKLPQGIQYIKNKYKQKMTGTHPEAINAIRSSIQAFNHARLQDIKLRPFTVYPYTDEKGIQNEQLYVVKIKGRKNTYYQGRIITFYMFVFDSFPKIPPEIVVSPIIDPKDGTEKRFKHINVSEHGQFCMKTTKANQQYYQYTTLKDILLQLQNNIYNPNMLSSYNNQLYASYKSAEDNYEYYQILNKQAKMLEKGEQSQSDSDSDYE